MNNVRGLGWVHPRTIGRLHVGARTAPEVTDGLPVAVDLREGMPPVYDQGWLGSCHDDQTEVLTDTGFKLFSALDGSERLATVNPETSELFFETPTRLVRFRYRGELHCVCNQSLNFRVTPDHQMLVRKWNEQRRTLNDHYELVAAREVGWYFGLLNRVRWAGEDHGTTYTLPGVPHKLRAQREPQVVSLAAWLRFLGIYLAEGTMLKRGQIPGRVSYKVQIAASKEREREFVRAALKEIGVHALELPDRFTFDNKRVYEALAALGLEGVKAGDKFAPAFIFKMNAAMIREFLAGHFAGDGAEQRGKRAHYTGSPRLAADLQALIFMSGDETRMTVRPPRSSTMKDGRTVTGRLSEHRISVCEKKNLSVERAEVWTTENYDGEVFCAEVPTYHTLVTRREGKILVSGNCTAQALAGAVEYLLKRIRRNEECPSRLAIYYAERSMLGTIMEDSGAMLSDGLAVLQYHGWMPESSWPYRPEHFTEAPTHAAIASMHTRRLINHEPLMHDAATLRWELAGGNPVAAGIMVYENFETVGSDGELGMPSGKQLGGHAVLLVGYREDGKFLVRNSWGTDYGMVGHCWIPEAYLTDPRECGELHTMRDVRVVRDGA